MAESGHEPMAGQYEGQQIGRYLVHQRLGGGGIATVYQAYDQVSGHSVALKVLPPNPDFATLYRFRREALMAGALRHPHIIRILQVGTVGNGPSAYIAMDLVEGESLAALLARYGQLRPEESCLLLEPVARALAFAHRQGVVHRDVKPSNVLLRPVGLRPANLGATQIVHLEMLEHPVVPLLSDFGIARFLDAPELTNEGRTVGTPAFMAPEQCMGSREIDGRADIYSLGTVLYRCVVGRLPFNGSTTQILHAHVFEPVVIDDESARVLPTRVVEILRRSLAKAAEDRYQDADELADELADVGATGGAATPMSQSAMLTGTYTMANLATFVPPTPSPRQVLVPGIAIKEGEGGAGNTPTQVASVRKRGPLLDTILWTALFFVLIGGGGLWAVQSWLAERGRTQGQPLSLPPVILMTRTPAIQSVEMLTSSVDAVVVPTASVAVPTAVVSPVPAVTPGLAVSPTSVVMPTPFVSEVPPLATALPENRPESIPENIEEDIMLPEAVVGVCPMVVDEFFMLTVVGLPPNLQDDFACPSAPAEVGVGSWLPFARGMMVAIEGSPLVYIYYANGTWERVARTEGANPANDPAQGGDVPGPLLPRPFAQVVALQGRQVLLGDPLQVEPIVSETLVQPYRGGILIGKRSDGQVLILTRSKLRL